MVYSDLTITNNGRPSLILVDSEPKRFIGQNTTRNEGYGRKNDR